MTGGDRRRQPAGLTQARRSCGRTRRAAPRRPHDVGDRASQPSIREERPGPARTTGTAEWRSATTTGIASDRVRRLRASSWYPSPARRRSPTSPAAAIARFHDMSGDVRSRRATGPVAPRRTRTRRSEAGLERNDIQQHPVAHTRRTDRRRISQRANRSPVPDTISSTAPDHSRRNAVTVPLRHRITTAD